MASKDFNVSALLANLFVIGKNGFLKVKENYANFLPIFLPHTLISTSKLRHCRETKSREKLWKQRLRVSLEELH